MRIFKVSLSILLLSLCLLSCNKYSKLLKSKDVDYKLAMADKYYAKKNYRNAQQLYETLYPVFKGTDKFEQLYYRDALCFYYMENYKDAENFFKGFLEVFPNSPKSEEVDYLHAYCFYKQSPKVELDQTNTTKSIGVMQSFINTHPGSARIKDATAIIDKCRQKLELKDYKAAELYYKIGQYRAAALSYEQVLNNYPESEKGDVYMEKEVKSYYMFAKMSYIDLQIDRFEKAIIHCDDFSDRYPDSKLKTEVKEYRNLCVENIKHIKEIKNEQAKTTTQH